MRSNDLKKQPSPNYMEEYDEEEGEDTNDGSSVVENGRAIIPDSLPSIIIEADACLTGLGGHDGRRYYTFPVSDSMSASHSISRLECLNCLLAARTLLTDNDSGKTVLVKCDNESTVYSLKFGRARDAVMAACARGMWFLGASKNINFIFEHVPGVNMVVADALSRVYDDTANLSRVQKFTSELNLLRVRPYPADLDNSSFL